MDGILIGRQVKVRSNDFIPRDLSARITYASEHERKLLLELNIPITIAGVTYTHAVASSRLARDDLNVLQRSGVLGCAVTWVPNDRFDKMRPLDITWWRGGAAAVTDIALE